jgi:hypothetical protein
MRSRLLTALALVAAFYLGWSVRGDRDVASAQAARKPIMMTRIYTGPDGLSHSEQTEMKLTPNGTSSMKATGVEFSSRPAAPAGDWHTGPRRQFVITLSGRASSKSPAGRRFRLDPGTST